MTPKEIRATFHYDAETGDLIWKIKRPGRGCVVGQVAGTINKRKDTSYRVITLNQKKLYAHRLVWIMHKGSIPDGNVIDHDDHDGLNNRLSNLLCTTVLRNQRNRRRKHNGNPLGIGGVYFTNGAFNVHIGHKYYGRRSDFFEACCLRKSLEAALGFKFNGQES